MSIEDGAGPEINETEERKPIEVWMVDDNTEVAAALRRGLSFIGDDFGFFNFDTAEQAISRINELIEKKQSLPKIILVDGDLEKDEGEFREGANLVSKIRKLEVPQPMLIAHSGNDLQNQKMMAAGADLIMEKGPKTQLKDYRKFLEEFRAKLAQPELPQS